MINTKKSISRLTFILIIILSIGFFIQLGKTLVKSIDKSRLTTNFITVKCVEIFTPGIKYIYWGNDHSFVKVVSNIFFPANKLIYEESSKNASTIPSEYLTYYKAVKQSEATGEAKEAIASVNKLTEASISLKYNKEQLLDYTFLVNEFFTVDRSTYIDEETLNPSTLLNTDLRIDKENGATILIYHTHSQEAFADSNGTDASTSIVAVGEYLAKLLNEEYGFNVIHNTQQYDLIDGKLDRSYAYTCAEKDLKKILAEHPEIEVIIDLHRDGIDGEKMTTSINGKETARIMFFNGLSRTIEAGEIESLKNPNLSGNLSMSLQAQLVANTKYPGFMRHIYLKGYQYNLHLLPKSMLIEAGSQKNTFQEMLNAMEPLADILNDVLTNEPILNR